MRDLGGTDTAVATAAGVSAALSPLSLEELEVVTQRLALGSIGLDDAARVDRLRALEELRCTVEADQAETTADFVVSQRALAAERGVPAARRDRGLGAQIGLAKRESPHRGQQDLQLAMVLRAELPHTRAAFRAGRIDRWKATLIAKETTCLSREHRMLVDERLCADPEVVEGLSIRQLIGRLHKAAATLDPASVAERRRNAEADRHVSCRPAPDTMTWVGALLPVKDGVAVYAALDREAQRAKNTGDERSIGQLMADTLVNHVVHPEVCPHPNVDSGSTRVPLMVNLIVLLGDEDGAGWVDGYGPVPGDLLRAWIADHLDADGNGPGADVRTWLRRVFEQPTTGDLVAMDSSASFFTGALADFLRIRDRRCRTPWCDAPIRHHDHVQARAEGGPTSAINGQGTCEGCNYAKEAHGWTARLRPGPRHTVENHHTHRPPLHLGRRTTLRQAVKAARPLADPATVQTTPPRMTTTGLAVKPVIECDIV